jgi:UDP-N-acetylglucosamine acyltransferase
MIHPTAIIHPRAQLDSTVDVGPFAVIEEGVALGPNNRVMAHVHLSGQTVIGAGNVFHPGCVIGNVPQDLKYRGAPSRTRIGDRNSFRENVTVNRATDESEDTVVGSNNLFMAQSHVAHNCQIGSGCIIANGALLAGHVHVHDRAVISGNCLVHQFMRIGTFAMMQGGSAISKDLPPYTVARGINSICGLNIVGLRRGGFTDEQRLELKQLYRFLFRTKLSRRAALVEARAQFTSDTARVLIEFVAAARRGICRDISLERRRGARDGGEEAWL